MSGMQLRPMSAGEILDRGFQTYRSRFPVMYLVALLGSAPVALWSSLSMGGAGKFGTGVGVGALFLLFLVVPVLTALVWAALVGLTDGAVRDEEIGPGTGLRLALPRVLPVIGFWLLAALVFVIPGILAGILIPLAAAGSRGGASAGAGILIIVVVGLALLVFFVLAMVVVSGLVFVGVPALVTERLGPGKAFSRALQLSKGIRLRLGLLSLLVNLIGALPGFAVSIVGIGLAAAATRATGTPGSIGGTTQAILFVLQLAVGAVATPFLIACMVMAYYDRRIRLEALDVELASAALEPAP